MQTQTTKNSHQIKIVNITYCKVLLCTQIVFVLKRTVSSDETLFRFSIFFLTLFLLKHRYNLQCEKEFDFKKSLKLFFQTYDSGLICVATYYVFFFFHGLHYILLSLFWKTFSTLFIFGDRENLCETMFFLIHYAIYLPAFFHVVVKR